MSSMSIRKKFVPMQLCVGDRFTDETGEWEIISRPQGTVGGKTIHMSVRKVGESTVTEERTRSAYERVKVRREVQHLGQSLPFRNLASWTTGE